MKICTFDGCDKKQHARGLCSSHRRQANAGRTLTPLLDMGNGKTLDDRFESRIERTDACWHWKGATSADGYGAIKDGDSSIRAHRFAYEKYVGKISPGRVIDHRCHNRLCVNPDHLRQVTDKQNGENRSGANKNSSTGMRGVFFDTKKGKYYGKVMHDRKGHWVGYFETPEEAERSVIKLRRELFTHSDMDRAIA